MDPLELSLQPVTELAPLIASRKVSPVELVLAYISRIESLDPVVKAFISVDSDRAMLAARQAETEITQGHYRGPLHGLCVAVKDNIETEQFITSAGSKLLSGWKPTEDAPVIDKLRKAGAIVLGKTNMHEFAYGGTCTNEYFGAVRNPWNTNHVPGGSSGGSAVAVALGMCSFALGTDTAGSVRLPAAMCGVVGYKPEIGRVSIHGVIPLAWSLDHVGPITHSVNDAAIVSNVIESTSDVATKAVASPTGARDLEGVRLGIPTEYFYEPLQPDVGTTVRDALNVLTKCGAELVEVEWNSVKHSNSITWTIILAEAAAYHRRWQSIEGDSYEVSTRANLEQGCFLPATAYVQAQRARTVLVDDANRVLKDVDALITPTLPITAPEIGQETVELGGKTREINPVFIRLTNPFNVTGFPAISVPCGFGNDGLPIGLQIATGRSDESTLLHVAGVYEKATDWCRNRQNLHLLTQQARIVDSNAQQ